MKRMGLAAILVVLSLGLAWGQTREVQLRVVDDLDQGVESNLSMILPDGQARALGTTDGEGRIKITEHCGQGSALRAEPRSPLYYFGRRPCPIPDEKLILTKKTYISNLISNAKALELNGENAKAALVYNEIAARSANVDSALARKSEEKTYALFFHEIKGNSALSTYVDFDADQGRAVLTDQGKKAVVVYQKAANLRPTGDIDYATLATAADSDVGQYLFRSLEEATAAAGPPD